MAALNAPIPLRLLAADGRSTLFGRLNIYDAAGVLTATLAAAHLAEGLYTATWTPNIEGYYTVVGHFFLDALFVVDAEYERTSQDVEVTTTKAMLVRILGLLHENAVVDQQGYDGNGNLTIARVRTYDTKPNALAAGVTGLLHTYSATATYTGTQLTNYTLVQDG